MLTQHPGKKWKDAQEMLKKAAIVTSLLVLLPYNIIDNPAGENRLLLQS